MCIGWRGVDWWAGRWRLHVIGDSGVRRRRKPHNHMQQDRHGHRKQVHDVPGQSESTSCSHQSHRRRAGRHYQLVAAHDFLAAATLNHHHQLLLLMCCLTSGGSLNCFCVRFSQYFNGRLCWLTLEMKRKRSLYFDFFCVKWRAACFMQQDSHVTTSFCCSIESHDMSPAAWWSDSQRCVVCAV